MEPANICVLLGGNSSEREVSLRSGQAVAEALRSLGHTVTLLDPKESGVVLPDGTEVVFLALHGTFGEDGTVQRLLEEIGAAYTGCGPEASELAFDKARTKEKCVQRGIPTARYTLVSSASSTPPEGWAPPMVLKPVRQGSSVGLQFVDEVSQWSAAIQEALKFDDEVLVEERIIGREVTVGILEDRPLPIVEIRPKAGAYDYQNKYTVGATEYSCPAAFPAEVTERIQAAALGAFEAIGGRDYARVDVMVNAEGAPVVLEVNTLPGMTETSLLPKAAAAAGITFPKLCERMVELAMLRGRLVAG